MIELSVTKKNSQLWEEYQKNKAEHNMLFPTEGAQLLGVSELELMLASPDSRYMGSDFQDVLNSLHHLSAVESIVRNTLAVHEKLGQYHNVKLSGHMGLMLNPGGLDLRFFVNQWKHMLAVDTTSNPKKPSHSIQFYDGVGNAINKIYLRDDSAEGKAFWEDLITKHVSTVTNKNLELLPPVASEQWLLKQLETDDVTSLHTQWLAMKDIHQFYGILHKLKLDKASSYHQAPENMTYALKPSAVSALLERAQEQQCPIMIFVGNTGAIQIQTGTIKNIKRMGEWINILDKSHNDFTLHLKDSLIDQLWCIKRPTKDGIVTSIEAFDKYGVSIVTFFGQRQEGQPERQLWQDITQHITTNFSEVSS